MPRAFFELLGICFNLDLKNKFLINFITFITLITIQIQTKRVIDYAWKQKQQYHWKIIMFDQEGVKSMKVIWSLLILFLHLNIKLRSLRKHEVKRK